MKQSPLSFLKKISSCLVRDVHRPCAENDWTRDPLSHPDIAKMTARERADLQWIAENIAPE
ncbi:type 2 periplasmic-binding domain-containing protein [Actibacterium mucosum]|uniref:hypothetical protein n=1 Tax=Actibacterium mucosum TaxID=1087332 RepID=UPI001268C940|nr:hypothetical protein [Actibacterium mucosum]